MVKSIVIAIYHTGAPWDCGLITNWDYSTWKYDGPRYYMYDVGCDETIWALCERPYGKKSIVGDGIIFYNILVWFTCWTILNAAITTK